MTNKTKIPAATKFPAGKKDDLTCSEEQIEALLEEGESTDADVTKKRPPGKPKSKKPSSPGRS
ncbi:MAG: hypothetical protein OEY28_06805 [Nitrospira sp.]|nr:hypothetical protein [Nitrospira sp.]